MPKNYIVMLIPINMIQHSFSWFGLKKKVSYRRTVINPGHIVLITEEDYGCDIYMSDQSIVPTDMAFNQLLAYLRTGHGSPENS